jgi:hypothetical protein
MQLLLLFLKTGQILISLSEQLEMEPKVHLIEPYEVSGKTKLTLTSWPPYSNEKDILMSSDSLLTVVEPDDTIRDLYLKKIGKTLKDIQPKDDKVLLTEGEEIPEYSEEEPYEPFYREVD